LKFNKNKPSIAEPNRPLVKEAVVRRLVSFVACVALAAPALAQSSHYVRGYVRKDGTYVAPHYQTNPDSSVLNNWSTRGNVNPYTGKVGTIDPYQPRTPSYSNPYGGLQSNPYSSPYSQTPSNSFGSLSSYGQIGSDGDEEDPN
jgi:hypothetical protein